MTGVRLILEEQLFSQDPYTTTLSATFAGDPNSNNILDPGEIWFYSAVKTYTFSQGDIFYHIWRC